MTISVGRNRPYLLPLSMQINTDIDEFALEQTVRG
jgi:hypothetical protein